MESKPPQDVPKKYKFMPKARPRRVPKAEVKTERLEDVDDHEQALNLMKQFQERSLKAKPKNEKKVLPSQVAFGFGATSSLKSYGIPKGRSRSSQDQDSSFNDSSDAPGRRGKEYNEPWDYYSYYPVTLPIRRPYSGNPAILDEQEFGEDSETLTYDENATNSALELGLLEENVEPNMLFVQLPPNMPMIKRSAKADSAEVKEPSKRSGGARVVEKTCRLEELPAGHMGKVLVYRSGAVKLKLGDTLYDVSPGMNSVFSQDVVAVNKEEKTCCVIAEIDKRAVFTPDVDAVVSGLAEFL